MSCTDVCIDFDDGAAVEFYRRGTVTARKQHSCYECRRQIEPGERYERASGKCEGDFWTAGTCAECVEIRTALVCGNYVEHGALWEAIGESVFPEWAHVGPYECLASIKGKAAREKLMAAFRDSCWAESDS
jgi:hypothetical protein